MLKRAWRPLSRNRVWTGLSFLLTVGCAERVGRRHGPGVGTCRPCYTAGLRTSSRVAEEGVAEPWPRVRRTNDYNPDWGLDDGSRRVDRPGITVRVGGPGHYSVRKEAHGPVVKQIGCNSASNSKRPRRCRVRYSSILVQAPFPFACCCRCRCRCDRDFLVRPPPPLPFSLFFSLGLHRRRRCCRRRRTCCCCTIIQVIGPGGKTINKIIEDFSLDTMNVSDDGRIVFSSFDPKQTEM